MKRLALLSVFSLMLAATVFAPVAMAQEPGDIDIQSVTLGTGGTAVVTMTIECTQGMQYQVFGEVRQTTGNRPYNTGFFGYPDTGQLALCQTTGTETFSTTVIGERPFRKGTVLVRMQAYVCDPTGLCRYTPNVYEEFRIR
jgi:hypothetical protein